MLLSTRMGKEEATGGC